MASKKQIAKCGAVGRVKKHKVSCARKPAHKSKHRGTYRETLHGEVFHRTVSW